MKPKVYVISRPSLDFHRAALFLADHGLEWLRTDGATEAEELIEFSGRICYLSFGAKQSPRTNAEYIHNLILSGHESVLEHASWSFVLSNVSRAFTHQLVRHRVGISFSQLSQQYHDEAEAKFVAPAELDLSPAAMEIWNSHMQASLDAYRRIDEALASSHNPNPGMARKERSRSIRSAARSVLPNATETKIVMTANARTLRHFLRVRGDIAGDYEMRLVAAEVLQVLKSEAPAAFFDLELKRLDDGSPRVMYVPGRRAQSEETGALRAIND